MEGLIPIVYKSLKKKKIQRRYECLSSGAAQPYNVGDFYAVDFDDHDRRKQELMTESGVGGAFHRRCNSVQGDRTSMDDAYKPKQLVRFRSHRMLSCLSAA